MFPRPRGETSARVFTAPESPCSTCTGARQKTGGPAKNNMASLDSGVTSRRARAHAWWHRSPMIGKFRALHARNDRFLFFRIFPIHEASRSYKHLIHAGRYWDRTSGPCRVKRGYGAYRSTIYECSFQLQQALGITRCHLMSRDVTSGVSQNCPS